MKTVRYLKLALLALPLCLCSCQTKKVADQPSTSSSAVQSSVQQKKFLQKVNDNAQFSRFITSKVKFTMKVGTQEMTLTGNLKMKRDDVIRLQLMAFGFVEAGRLEFTSEYILVMDRINKLYMMVPYAELAFLRASGLNFYSLQALFWNELFLPGESKVTDEGLKNFETIPVDNDFVIRLDKDQMSYSWLAEQDQALIKMANVLHKDRFDGNTQLNWNYSDFENVGKKQFPTRMHVTLTSPKKEVSLGIKLNYIGHESDWESRTVIPGKYKKVTVDEILRRFMAL
ncbi:MAG: DUF4292 domain-containing protein [Prevotella sp.]|nr:DUF4292 domain-containing protein [Prevotella sp.]